MILKHNLNTSHPVDLVSFKVDGLPNGEISDSQMKKINNLKVNGPNKKLTKDDVFVRTMLVMGEEPTSKMSIHPEGILNGKTVRVLSQLTKGLPGAPRIDGHNFDSVPWGRIFDAKIIRHKDYTGNVIKIWFYFLKNEAGQKIADEMDSGIRTEGSISYQYQNPKCSICHGNIGWSLLGTNGKRCKEHQIGESYNTEDGEQICYYYPSEILCVLEVSDVFRGAYPKTKIDYATYSPEVRAGLELTDKIIESHSINPDEIDLNGEGGEDDESDTESTENSQESDEDGNGEDDFSTNSDEPEESEDSGTSSNESLDEDGGDGVDGLDSSHTGKNVTDLSQIKGTIICSDGKPVKFRPDDITIDEINLIEVSDNLDSENSENNQDETTTEENSDTEKGSSDSDSENSGETESNSESSEESSGLSLNAVISNLSAGEYNSSFYLFAPSADTIDSLEKISILCTDDEDRLTILNTLEDYSIEVFFVDELKEITSRYEINNNFSKEIPKYSDAFVIQEHRVNNKIHYDLRICDSEGNSSFGLTLFSKPCIKKCSKVLGSRKDVSDLKWMSFSEDSIEPRSPGNPYDGKASLKIIDSGICTFVRREKEFFEILLNGTEYNGRYYISTTKARVSQHDNSLSEDDVALNDYVNLFYRAKVQDKESTELYDGGYPRVIYSKPGGAFSYYIDE